MVAGIGIAVEALLDRGGERLRERMARIELHLERVTAAAGAPLAAHASATIMAGGKRLRPLLVVLAAEAAGSPEPDAVDAVEERLTRAAVAVELVHSATLVHDDVIDVAPLRRGRPTVAAAAGRQIAIATGDLLFSRAFAELARNEDPAQLRALSDASSALAAGELLQREDAYAPRVAIERYLQALRAEDGRAVRSGLPARRARRRGSGGASVRRISPMRSVSSRGASGWPSRSSTTCSTSPARSSAPARRVARTCSTAPSRCR